MFRNSLTSSLLNSVVSLSTFHRTAGFWGFYLIVFYSLIEIMLMLETLLMPFLWAFFVCMALYPFVDLVEDLMVFSWAFFRSLYRGKSYKESVAEAWDVADQPRDEMGDRFDKKFRRMRYVAAFIILMSAFGLMCLCGYFVFLNGRALYEKRSVYVEGFERFGRSLATFIDDMQIPFIPEKSIEHIRSGKFFDLDKLQTRAVTHLVLDGPTVVISWVLTLVYMVFWMFGPMPLDPSVRSVFQRYILIKSMISAAYACSVFMLLFFFDVDMRVAFAVLTFILNFVPEIGAILSIGLPLPIILFNGKDPHSIEKALFVFIGECLLKVLFGNILEVAVLEADFQMRMHPVVILLCIAFFGWTWGPTGMLLSVPIMAAFKALVATSAIPDKYRDPILVMMEGDVSAPRRWDQSALGTSIGFSPFTEARKSSVVRTTGRESISQSRRTTGQPDGRPPSAGLLRGGQVPQDFSTRREEARGKIQQAEEERRKDELRQGPSSST